MKPHHPPPGTVLAVLLLALAGAAGAQETSGDAELSPLPTQDEASGSAGSATDAGADPAGDKPPGKTRTPNQTSSPPPDYEASEQIREDLPVSFPVDI